MFGVAAHEKLKAQVSALSYVDDVLIYDADGEIINSSGAWPPPTIDISARHYFQVFKSDPQSPPFLAEALRSYLHGRWTMVLAHRLTGANGVFLGVMTRRIDPANYEKFFASVALGEGSAIALLHADGTMLARFPHAEDMIGKKVDHLLPASQTISSGRPQTIRLHSPVDGQDRIGAIGPVDNFPMVVVATRTIDAALADWRAQTRLLIATAAVVRLGDRPASCS